MQTRSREVVVVSWWQALIIKSGVELQLPAPPTRDGAEIASKQYLSGVLAAHGLTVRRVTSVSNARS